jgi:hypothetical protein
VRARFSLCLVDQAASEVLRVGFDVLYGSVRAKATLLADLLEKHRTGTAAPATSAAAAEGKHKEGKHAGASASETTVDDIAASPALTALERALFAQVLPRMSQFAQGYQLVNELTDSVSRGTLNAIAAPSNGYCMRSHAMLFHCPRAEVTGWR